MTTAARWLYHVALADEWARAGDPYAPASLDGQGFVHASYRDAVLESARLYFPADRAKVVLRVDPRLVGAPIEEAATPRGPMPHVHGAIARRAIAEVVALDAFDPSRAPDAITPVT